MGIPASKHALSIPTHSLQYLLKILQWHPATCRSRHCLPQLTVPSWTKSCPSLWLLLLQSQRHTEALAGLQRVHTLKHIRPLSRVFPLSRTFFCFSLTNAHSVLKTRFPYKASLGQSLGWVTYPCSVFPEYPALSSLRQYVTIACVCHCICLALQT